MNDMIKAIRQYTPDDQPIPDGSGTDKPGVIGGSQGMSDANQYDEDDTSIDSDEDDSSVSRRGKNIGTLTGTDRDKTKPGETRATES